MDIFNKAVERAAHERKNHIDKTVRVVNEDDEKLSTDESETHHEETISAKVINEAEGELIVRKDPEDFADIQYDKTPIRRPNIRTAVYEDRADAKLSTAEHAYNILRTKVLQQMHRHNWNMAAVTSPAIGNGKTTTAVNLATSIARSANHTVLLVDLNLHNPSVHEHFGVEPVFGITDVVSGKVGFEDAVFNPGIPRLTVLPGSEKINHSSEFLSSSRMEQFVSEIRSRYPRRIVLFDMPPTLGSADVLAFLPLVQAVLLVLEAGQTSRSQLHRVMKTLEQARIIGTVLNRGVETIDN
jgi:capsular exopolysaccharide synthesis family protein